jgi:hypothetical protein
MCLDLCTDQVVIKISRFSVVTNTQVIRLTVESLENLGGVEH